MTYTIPQKSLISMCAFAALANCAKADIEYAREHQGTGRVVVHDPDAAVGRGDERFKWTIVSPDGSKGFGNDFMTNALSVVTEDGTNYYAHVQGENNDRTKVIHFTVNKDGIPNKQCDVIDTTVTTTSAETNTVAKMQNKKLMGVRNGYLYFYSTDNFTYSSTYFPAGSQKKYKEHKILGKCLDVYQDDYAVYFLVSYGDANGEMGIQYFNQDKGFNMASVGLGPYSFTTIVSERYQGASDGWVIDRDEPEFLVQLPGAVSGLSNNGDEVFATSESTNAFYNVTLGDYNVVKDENGSPKPMVPSTKEGLLRVIDNRKKGGKFLYVTRKGVHAIE